MKKLTLVLMTVVLGMLLTVPAFAFGQSEGGSPAVDKGQSACNKPALWKLNLSAEQKTKIFDLSSHMLCHTSSAGKFTNRIATGY